VATILVVDDDELVRELLADAVGRRGHRAVCAGTLAEARRALAREEPDLVYLDVRLPDGSGINALEEIRASASAPEVIIITGQGDPDGAELALRCGAWDYIEKPTSVERMVLPLLRALAFREEKQRRSVPTLAADSGIVGTSPKMAACLARAAMAAASRVDVFISGETGTGKEVFAQAIHQSGSRAKSRFVVVDCTTLPGNLAESELFGHERGSFTGADRRQTGLIQQADGGTLFLDEVGELPLPVQAKFLRVLQERRFRPLGGEAEIKSDFRLVAATNRDLSAMVRRGEFRDDLLYRLRVFRIELPPLREREGDIAALVQAHLAKTRDAHGGSVREASPEYMELLEAHDWPGNVRELLQTVDMSLVSAHGDHVLLPQHLPLDLRVRLMRRSVTDRAEAGHDAAPGQPGDTGEAGALKPWREHRARVLDNAEHAYFSTLLLHTNADVAHAALLSGLKPARFYELLAKHGLLKARRDRTRIPGFPEK
jgi:two-component system, NtrC family, response regulator